MSADLLLLCPDPTPDRDLGNPYHDPNTGRFTSKAGSGGVPRGRTRSESGQSREGGMTVRPGVFPGAENADRSHQGIRKPETAKYGFDSVRGRAVRAKAGAEAERTQPSDKYGFDSPRGQAERAKASAEAAAERAPAAEKAWQQSKATGQQTLKEAGWRISENQGSWAAGKGAEFRKPGKRILITQDANSPNQYYGEAIYRPTAVDFDRGLVSRQVGIFTDMDNQLWRLRLGLAATQEQPRKMARRFLTRCRKPVCNDQILSERYTDIEAEVT